jgi:hypothetical protein
MRTTTKILAPLALTLCHCVPPSPSSVAQRRGAEDLQCPLEDVKAYRAGDGEYIARGCGHWVQYDCIASGRGTVARETICVARGNAQVNELP